MPNLDKSKMKDDSKAVIESKMQASAQTEMQKENPIKTLAKKLTAPETPQFDAWVKSLFTDKKNTVELNPSKENSKDDFSPTLNLGRFGLRTYKDVLVFLHSHEGKATLAKIEDEINMSKSLRDSLLFQALVEGLLRLLLKAFFLSAYLNRKSNAAQQLRELILEQNEAAIKASKPKPNIPVSHAADEARNDAMEKAMLEFDAALGDIMTYIKQGEGLDLKMSDLLQEGHRIETKYDLWETDLTDLILAKKEEADDLLTPTELNERLAALSKDDDKIAEMLSNPKHANSKVLQNDHKDLLAKINGLKNMLSVQHGIKLYVDAQGNVVDSMHKADLIIAKGQTIVEKAGLFYLLEPNQTWASIQNNLEAKKNAHEQYNLALNELKESKLHSRLHKFSMTIDKKVDLMRQHLDAERIEEATALKNQITGLYFKYGHLQDVLAVLKGEKQFVNMKGEPVKTQEEAFCIIPKMQPLVSLEKQIVEHNGVYYLLDKNQNWDSIKDSPEAQLKARQDLQREKLESKMALKCVLGQNKVLEKGFHLQRLEETGKEIEINQTQKQNAENQLRLMQTLIPKLINPTAQPQLNPEAPRPSPSMDSPALAKTTLFRSKMKEMTQTPTLTQEELNNLAQQAPGDTRHAAMEFIQKNMPRSGIIPQVTMQFLLRNLEQFGVDTTNPSVTNIDKPSKVFSPFNMRPDPK